jgi:hypothetical protein
MRHGITIFTSESTIMNRVPRLLSRAALVAVVAAMPLLSACTHGVKGQEIATRKLEQKIDLKLEAYKSGQFLLDGAVLSAIDLNSHFAYLRDQHRLPHSVLLKPSEDAKIKKAQLLSLARMQMTYGFAVFYEHDDKLVRLEVTNAKDVPQLQRHSNSAPLPDGNAGTSASGSNHFPTGG